MSSSSFSFLFHNKNLRFLQIFLFFFAGFKEIIFPKIIKKSGPICSAVLGHKPSCKYSIKFIAVCQICYHGKSGPKPEYRMSHETWNFKNRTDILPDLGASCRAPSREVLVVARPLFNFNNLFLILSFNHLTDNIKKRYVLVK